MAVILADMGLTMVVMAIVYKWAKRKSSAGRPHTPKGTNLHPKEPFLRASLVTSFILVYFLIFDWLNLTWLLLLLTVTDLWCVLFPSSYSSWSSSRRPSSTCPIAWLRGECRIEVFILLYAKPLNSNYIISYITRAGMHFCQTDIHTFRRVFRSVQITHDAMGSDAPHTILQW